MKKQELLILFFILYIFPLQAQKTLQGKIISSNIPIEYASVVSKATGINQYTDKEGLFFINTSSSDTLIIKCVGYNSREILLQNQPKDLVIELEQSAEILKEITISINANEKSKWKKVNKKTKRFDSTYQGLAEGYILFSSYKIDEEIKFNGIRLFIMVNTLNPDGSLNKNFKKITRPFLIINSDNLEDNILPNKIISLDNNSDLFTNLDIEFKNTIHLLPNETLTIGLELIPENLNKPNLNNVMGVLTTKHLLPESETYFKNVFSKETKANIGKLNEDIYFELKVVK